MQDENRNSESRAATAGRDAEVVSCPSCHATLARGLRFCRMCGYRLGEGVEEYAETRRFDGKMPPVSAPPHGATGTAAGAPFQMPHAWGAVAPISPSAPSHAHGSSLGRLAKACNPARLGWMFWIILSIVVMTAGGIAVKQARQRGAFGGTARTAPAPQSFLEVDGFDTADGGGAFIEGLAASDTSLERAGLLGGDIITRFDGQPVKNDDDIIRIIRATPPGKTVDVEFVRDGETKTTTLTTIDRKDYKGTTALDTRPGGKGQMGVDDLDRVRVPGTNTYGVELGEIVRNNPADIAGLKKGDVVTEFNGKPVRTEGDLRLRIYEAMPGSVATVVVMRDGQRLEIPVKVGRSRG